MPRLNSRRSSFIFLLALTVTEGNLSVEAAESSHRSLNGSNDKVGVFWPEFIPHRKSRQLASQSSSVVSEFDLSECLKKAKGQSLQVVQGVIQEAMAKAAYEESASQRLPQFFAQSRFALSNLDPDQLSDANRAVVRVEQKLNPFFGVFKEAEQRKYLSEAASAARVETWQDAALWVKKLYHSNLKLKEAQERLERAEEIQKILLNTVIPRFTVRRAQPFDLVKVKVGISDIERAKKQTFSQLEGEKTHLSQILGISTDVKFSLKALTEIPSLPKLDNLLKSFQENPTLKTLDYNVKSAEVAVSGAKLARLPDLTAGFDYGYGGAVGKEFATGWEASLMVRFPLFDWGLISSQIEQQQSQLSLAKNKLDLEKQRIIADIYEIHSHATAQFDDHKRLRELLPEVQEAAKVAVLQYKTGGSGILETTDAIQLWIQTLINERASFYSYLDDIALLDRLTGVLHGDE